MLLVCFETTIHSHPGKVDSNKNWTFVITENTFSIFNRISSLKHVIVTMSLSIRGVSYYSEYDIYYYVDDIYDWLEDSHPRRGDIKIELTSPQGTKSILLPYHNNYDMAGELTLFMTSSMQRVMMTGHLCLFSFGERIQLGRLGLSRSPTSLVLAMFMSAWSQHDPVWNCYHTNCKR